jgi:hypothetical protein
MAKGSVINVAVLADTKQFVRKMGEASNKLGDFGSKVGRVGTNVAKSFAVMGAAAAGLSAVAGKKLFDLGEELTSLDTKINTVFSDQSLQTVTNWADQVAARMGLTRTQAQGLAAGVGDLLKPMGFSAQSAADMSTELVGLAGALSEWSAGQRSVEETAEILQKAVLGEREGLKQLGISINQAEVDQKALAIATYFGRDAITAQDKALATQSLILEKSTDAQAAYAAGGNKLTEASNRLRAAFGELQERLARKLLPVFAKAAEIVLDLIEVFDKDGLSGVISNVADRMKEALPVINNKLREWLRAFVNWAYSVTMPMLAALGDMLRRFGSWLVNDGYAVIVEKLASWARAFVEWVGPMIEPALRALGGFLSNVLQWMVNVGQPKLIENLGKWAKAFIGWVVDIYPGVTAALWKMLGDLGQWLVTNGVPLMLKAGMNIGRALRDGIFAALRAGLTGTLSLAKDVVNAIITLINTQVIRRINRLLEFSIAGISINPPDIPNIPRLADGGIVTSPTLALIGEAGPEAVVPLDRAGAMGGTTVNVYMPTGANGDDVVRALTDYQRRRGSIPITASGARF